MALTLTRWLRGTVDGTPYKNVDVNELCNTACELYVRELAFAICANLIANAIGKCEFRTYKNGEEVREAEYYLWNVEPNQNQNSSAFLHKLVGTLMTNNEALVLCTKARGGAEQLIVADSFAITEYALKPNEYSDICVGQLDMRKTYREPDVLHLTLNHKGIKTALNGIAATYAKLISSATDYYDRATGQHWKVHVNQTAQGQKDWLDNFKQMIEAQVKPFMSSKSAMLPEFDGYEYTDVGKEKTPGDTRDIRKLVDDVFDFTAKAFLIPPVLFGGEVAGTADAMRRWLTVCIDPLCDQIQEETNRKRYGYDAWQSGSYMHIDTSSITHFDMFDAAAGVEKLIGSGVFTVNDILTAAGLPRIEETWADERYMTKNFTTVGELLKQTGGEKSES